MIKSIAIMGMPGSGKGTVCRILSQIPQFVHVGIGDILRSFPERSVLGEICRHYLDQGDLVPDDITIEVFKVYSKGVADCGFHKKILLLDNLPRNMRQMEMLMPITQIIGVINLQADNGPLFDRLTKRAHGRVDDKTSKAILRRMAIYRDITEPIIKYFPQDCVYHIDADRSLIEVMRDVFSAVSSIVDSPKPPNHTDH